MPSASSNRRITAARIALCVIAACHIQPAMAQRAAVQAEYFIAESDRTVEPARPAAVILAQEELATSIELGRILVGEGGLLGALTDRTPERLAQNAAVKAHRFAKPVREALAGFDAAPLALSATRQALTGASWFADPAPQVLSGASMALTSDDPVAIDGDSTVSMTFAMGSFDEEANDTAGALNWNTERSRLEQEFAAAHPQASEIAVLSWRYQLSADFTNIQVIVDVATRKPDARPRLYKQQLISIVKLRRPTFVEEDNVAIWAAKDGALARAALEMAFQRAGEVLPSILSLNGAQYAAATDKKTTPTATAAGFHGPQLMRDEKGAVFHARDGDQRLRAFVAVQTIRN